MFLCFHNVVAETFYIRVHRWGLHLETFFREEEYRAGGPRGSHHSIHLTWRSIVQECWHGLTRHWCKECQVQVCQVRRRQRRA